MPYVAKLIMRIASQPSWYPCSGTGGFLTSHTRQVCDPHVQDAITVSVALVFSILGASRWEIFRLGSKFSLQVEEL